MNLNESIRDWIDTRITAVYTGLAAVERVTMNDIDDLDPLFIRIFETGSSIYQQGDVTMDGVSQVEITVELHTTPGAETGETSDTVERTYRENLYDILGDRDAIAAITNTNEWRVFDIRLSSPITEANEGRMVSSWNLSIIACPI